jgi:hypothetical protein
MRMSANITNSSKSGFPQIRQAMRISVNIANSSKSGSQRHLKAMRMNANIANSSKSGFPMASQGDANEREYYKQLQCLPNGFARRCE